MSSVISHDYPVLLVLCVISLYGQSFCLLKEKNTQLCATLRLQCQPGFNIVRGIRHNLLYCGLDRAVLFSGEEISAEATTSLWLSCSLRVSIPTLWEWASPTNNTVIPVINL